MGYLSILSGVTKSCKGDQQQPYGNRGSQKESWKFHYSSWVSILGQKKSSQGFMVDVG